MNTIIENLNTVITTKSQIQSIIKENGIDPGEVFSDYPQYIRQVISGGGSDKVSYSYLEEKLSYYPTYSYTNENYVSYSYLGDLEDITYYILGSGDPYSPENVYATKFELASYVKTSDLQSMSYVSITDLSSMGYITSNDLPVIDENIIPKENNTYTLGDESHLYSATYSARLKVGNNSQIYNDGGGITFSVNSNAGIRMGSSNLYPKNNKGMNLGQSSNKWSSTYTANFYADTTYTEKLYFNSGNEFYNDNSYQIVLKLNNSDKYVFRTEYIRPISNNGATLGTSNFKFNATYTSNIYTNTAYISSATYLPVNTYWYDGNSYHWLGDLFN